MDEGSIALISILANGIGRNILTLNNKRHNFLPPHWLRAVTNVAPRHLNFKLRLESQNLRPFISHPSSRSTNCCLLMQRLAVCLLVLFCVLSTTALLLHANFEPVMVKDINIEAVSANAGYLDLTSCSVACVAKGDMCSAFHHSSNGVCRHILKTQIKAVMEKVGASASSLKVWTRERPTVLKTESENCTAADYPHYRDQSRYQLKTDSKTWSKAAEGCQAKGGWLAELTTAEEHKFVVDSMLSSADAPDAVHIGLIKSGSDWKWQRSGDAFTGTWGLDHPQDSLTYGSLSKLAGWKPVSVSEYFPDESICECKVQ